MDDLFAELRSTLHHTAPDMRHLQDLLLDARKEHWDYARPFLDRLHVGNRWGFAQGQTHTMLASNPLDVYEDVRFVQQDVLATHIIELESIHANAGYTRLIWTSSVRRALHRWMGIIVERHFDALPTRNAELIWHTINSLEHWSAHDYVDDEEIKLARRELTSKWLDLGSLLDVSDVVYASVADEVEQGISGAIDAFESVSLSRLFGTGLSTLERATTMGIRAMSRMGLDLLRQQWLIWMLLCATDIAKAPMLGQFAKLASQYAILDAINQRIEWDEYPLRVLVFVEGMLQEQVRERHDVRRRLDQQYESLGRSLGSFLQHTQATK